MSQTTFSEKRSNQNGQQESKNEGTAWKQVTLGGVSGILMGAGLLYGGQVAAHELEKGETTDDVTVPNQGETSHALMGRPQATTITDDLSFGEAFAQARAEVGPGGVFLWHGGIYNTYTVDEWNAMAVNQKLDFAHRVKPEVRVDELPTPTDANTRIIVEHHVYHHEVSHPNTDPDVKIVGYGKVEGHLAVEYDMDGDKLADFAIIDVDDTGTLTNPDVVISDQGDMATWGYITGEYDYDPLAVMDNPDVAPDMPDYMNNAMIDPTFNA